MKIVIAGCGKVGQEIISHLVSEGHSIVAIDSNPSVVEKVINKYDVLGILGNCVSIDILEKAGSESADLFIAVTSSDEVNMVACFEAKKVGVKSTIARVRNYDINTHVNRMKEDLAIDMVINPESEAAVDIQNIINFPEAIEVDLFANGRLNLVEFYLQEDSKLVGKTLSEVKNEYNSNILVCAIQRGNEVVIPYGSTTLKPKDRIHIAGDRLSLKEFLDKLGLVENKIKNIMIIGCGVLTVYLAESLIKNGYKVKIIEKDKNICEKYAAILPKANIIFGDASDQTLLEEENIQSTDAIISLTGMDETNIIISMYAEKRHVHKIIAKIDKSSYELLVGNISDASVISPKSSITSRIIRYVRSLSNAVGSNIETLHKIVNNKVEAIEFIAKENSKTLNIPLKDLKTKKDTLIASIVRGEEVIIPSGLDSIMSGDSVVVITKADRTFDDLDDILA